MKYFTKTIIFSFVTCVLYVHQASALSLSPGRTVLTIDPGTTAEITLSVTNNESKKMSLRPSVIGVKQDTEGRAVLGKNFDDAESWVGAKVSSLELNSGETGAVKYAITVPQGSLPGSHWVGLAVESVSSGGASAVLNERVVSLVSIQVSGIVTEAVTAQAKLANHFLWNGRSTAVTVQFKNNGTIETPLSGKISVRTLAEEKITESAVQLGNQIIPQAERTAKLPVVIMGMPTFFGTAACSGQSSEKVFCPKLSWPGLYKISVEVAYGKTQQLIFVEDSFWYMPLWSMAIVLLGITLLILFWRKRRQKKMMQHYVS